MRMKSIRINIEYMSARFMNPDYSDVTLIVEGKEFPVIRHFLAMHSSFFECLFNGNFEDGKKDKLELKDVKVLPFEILLHYIYFGDIELQSIEKEQLKELAYLADFFGMPGVLQQIDDYMSELPKQVDNVVDLVNLAAHLSLEKLLKSSLDYIFSRQEQFIEGKLFVTFNEAALFKLLDSNEWTIKESEIVMSLVDWLDVNSTTKRTELLQKIRLPLIETDALIEKVQPKNLFTDEEIYEALLREPNNNYRKNFVRYIKTERHVTLRKFCHLYETNYNRMSVININIQYVSFISVHCTMFSYLTELSYKNPGYSYNVPVSHKSNRFYISTDNENPIDVNKIIVTPSDSD